MEYQCTFCRVLMMMIEWIAESAKITFYQIVEILFHSHPKWFSDQKIKSIKLLT